MAKPLNSPVIAEKTHVSLPIRIRILGPSKYADHYKVEMNHAGRQQGFMRSTGQEAREIANTMWAYCVGMEARKIEADDDTEEDECEGHESLAGAHMGEAVYCDGSCRGRLTR